MCSPQSVHCEMKVKRGVGSYVAELVLSGEVAVLLGLQETRVGVALHELEHLLLRLVEDVLRRTRQQLVDVLACLRVDAHLQHV